MFKPFAPHMVDGYKLEHGSMYAEGTDFLYSNLTPRSNHHFKGSSLYDGKMVVFGALGAIQEIVALWDETFFSVPKTKAIARFKRRVEGYLGQGKGGVDRMAALHDLGYLPLEIKSLDEGLRIKMKVPMLTIKNTHPDFFWLVNYLETVLSAMIWKGCTNATIAYEYKRIATDYAVRTGSPVEGVMYQIHDFSMRGMPGLESACRSSAAHLTCGVGTDTVGAIDYIEDFYGTGVDLDKYLIGCSVPATEHAVSSSNILTRAARMERQGLVGDTRLIAESEFLYDYITKIVPTGIASYVDDTYDHWGVLTTILTMPKIRKAVLERDGKLVMRPDSGDPVEVICGVEVTKVPHHSSEFGDNWKLDPSDECVDSINDVGYAFAQDVDGGDEVSFLVESSDGVMFRITGDCYNDRYANHKSLDGFSAHVVEELSPEEKGSIQLLWENFGGTINAKGFKELDSHIGLIYGDSITIDRAERIFKRLADKGFASGNVVFGVGSYTYQMNTRDTFGTAMKATATAIKGDFFEIYKDPATGDKLKKSAKGLLHVGYINGELELTDQVSPAIEAAGMLKTRFKDGVLQNLEGIDVIRARLS